MRNRFRYPGHLLDDLDGGDDPVAILSLQNSASVLDALELNEEDRRAVKKFVSIVENLGAQILLV
ncbi:MAG: hypothetical protein ACERK9_12535 [Deltaproteobacteria bacterium]